MFVDDFEQLSQEDQAFVAALLLFDRHTLPELTELLPKNNTLSIDSLARDFLELERSKRIHFLVSRLLELVPLEAKRMSALVPADELARALSEEPEPLRQVIGSLLSAEQPPPQLFKLEAQAKDAILSSFFSQFH
jgi:hypothetical protein